MKIQLVQIVYRTVVINQKNQNRVTILYKIII